MVQLRNLGLRTEIFRGALDPEILLPGLPPFKEIGRTQAVAGNVPLMEVEEFRLCDLDKAAVIRRFCMADLAQRDSMRQIQCFLWRVEFYAPLSAQASRKFQQEISDRRLESL